MRQHQLEACKNPNVRLWRNNVGTAYTVDGRFIRFGLCPGSADLIGFESIEITPDMVGKRIAVFRADEIKTGKGRLSQDQEKWLQLCESMGAITRKIHVR